MKTIIKSFFIISAIICPILLNAQTFEWKLVNYTYSNVDPDSTGPATGVATFTLRIHTVSGSAVITGIGTGWAWQSASAMLPTGSPCGTTSVTQPANISMSAAFAGFTYNFVDECSGSTNFTTGGQTFDRRAVGTVDGGSITIDTNWKDVFTVTLWAKNISFPQAGYVAINSGDGGTPGAFSGYSVSDALANGFTVNSLTYNTPLPLGGTALPVTFSSFAAACQSGAVQLSWSTEFENNSSEFIVQKSMDGSRWTDIGQLAAAGSSSSRKDYRFTYRQTGSAMYRVKMLELNGHSTFTEIKSTACGMPAATTVYPMPSKDILHVNIPSQNSQRVQLILTDASGRRVRTAAGVLNDGMNPYSINISALTPGYYLLQVIRDQQAAENIPVIKE